jgi:tetratricopeptide (TPR) repeat protein
LDRAIKSSTKAAELSESAGNVEDVAYAYHVLAWSHLLRSQFDRVFAYKEKVFRTLDKKLNFVVLVRTLTAASAGCTFLGRWDSAVEHAQEALLLAKRSSDKSLITQATYILAMAYSFMGESKLAIEHAELSVKNAPSTGIRQWSRMFSGGAWCRFGEPKKGIETLVSILPDLQAGRFFAGQVAAMYYLAEGYLIAGDLAKATETAEDLLELAEPRGARFHSGCAQRILGEVALKTEPSQATPLFEKAISIFREIKAENELALAYTGMGRLHKHKGDIEKARESLTKALGIFERLGTLLEPDKVMKELADLPQ